MTDGTTHRGALRAGPGAEPVDLLAVDPTYELLDVVNLKDVRTTAQVAARLGIEEKDAARQLRLLERDGLAQLHIDESVNVPRDFNREYWTLTTEGRAVWERLDAEHSDT